MAKKSKTTKRHSKMHQHVPHWVSYTLIFAAALVVWKLLSKHLGYGMMGY